EEQDDEPVFAAGSGELVDFLMAQVHPLLRADAGERNTDGRIPHESIVPYGRGEDEGEDAVHLARRRCRPLTGYLGDPRLDCTVADVGEFCRTPSGNDVRAKDACVALTRRRLQVRLPVQPAPGPQIDGETSGGRIDVGAR